MLAKVILGSLVMLNCTGCEWWYKQPDPLGGGNTKLITAPPLIQAQDPSSDLAPKVTPAPCIDPTPPNAEGYDSDDDDNCLN